MFTHSHLLIGRHINETVNKSFPIGISLWGYLYGCAAPDWAPGFWGISHRKEESFSMVTSLVHNTLETVPESRSQVQKYSANLGIITHFICDYFCAAHHNADYTKPLDHARYENVLARKVQQTDLSKLAETNYIKCIRLDSPQLLMEYLDYKYENYLKHAPGTFLDICYSVKTSAAIILSMVNHLQGRAGTSAVSSFKACP
jgi:hypothetical protein